MNLLLILVVGFFSITTHASTPVRVQDGTTETIAVMLGQRVQLPGRAVTILEPQIQLVTVGATNQSAAPAFPISFRSTNLDVCRMFGFTSDLAADGSDQLAKRRSIAVDTGLKFMMAGGIVYKSITCTN